MKSLKSTLTAAALVFAVAAGAAAAAPAKPDATETIYWQSTEKLGTPDAYRAYLATYPEGFFTPLAKAALGSTPMAPKPAPRASVEDGPGALKPFTESPESGSVNFKLGEEFTGPVGLTVGWLGARRQLVLPAGHWIALSALDEMSVLPAASYTNPVRVKLATATFGKFAGTRLTSVLRFTFSAEKTAPAAWAALPPCQKSTEVLIRTASPTKSGVRDECTALGVQANPLSDGSAPNVEALNSLSRLGGSVAGPALVGTLTFSERRYGYLRVTRYEWLGDGSDTRGQTVRDWAPGALEASETRSAHADRFWAWLQGYRDAVALGYVNDFEGPAADFIASASK